MGTFEGDVLFEFGERGLEHGFGEGRRSGFGGDGGAQVKG